MHFNHHVARLRPNRRFSGRFPQFFGLLAGLWGCCLSGCAIPEYHFPQGFSSTYHRVLWGPSSVVRLPSIPPPMEHPLDPPGVFYPYSIDSPQPSRSPRGLAEQPTRGDRSFSPPATPTAQRVRSRL